MSAIETLLGTIDEAIRGTGERRRHALLERATRLFIEQNHELTDHHISVFDEVIVSLLGDVETHDRVALAERLADLTRVPKKTTRGLALDDELAVARPIILRSASLDDDTLITITREKGPEHLSLVAKRRALPSIVLDHLIMRADENLLVDIARNETTPISDGALRLLAERALSHHTLYRILRTRPDFAMRHIGAVIEAARYRAKSDLISRDMDDDHLSRALARDTAKKLAEAAQMSFSSASPATKQMELTQADLHDLLERNQIETALIALASQSGVTTESVKRAFHAPQHEPMMILLRAQDYPLPTVMQFMRRKHGTMSDELETQLSEAYCAIARDTAKRLANFMAEKHVNAGHESDETEPLRHSA